MFVILPVTFVGLFLLEVTKINNTNIGSCNSNKISFRFDYFFKNYIEMLWEMKQILDGSIIVTYFTDDTIDNSVPVIVII